MDNKKGEESVSSFMAEVKDHGTDGNQKQKLNKLCFIDASSLVDENESTEINNVSVCSSNFNGSVVETTIVEKSNELSPSDLEKTHCFTPENELDTLFDDSLEQGDKEPASIQKDLSPSIFEMTIQEDLPNQQEYCVNTHASSNEIDVKTLNLTTEVLNHKNVKIHDGMHEQRNLRKELLSRINIILPETPHNSIMALNSEPVEINDSTESIKSSAINSSSNDKLIEIRPGIDNLPENNSSTVSSTDNNSSPVLKDKIVYTSDESLTAQQRRIEKSGKKVNAFSRSAWIIDMSGQPAANTRENEIKPPENNFLLNNSTECQTKSSLESNASEKSSQKFFIDFSSIPDPEPSNSKIPDPDKKGNIFSMFIGFEENNSNKMSDKLVSSLNSRRLGLGKAKQESDISKSVSTIEKLYSSTESIIKNHTKKIVPQLASRSNCRDMENLRIKSDLNKESVNVLKHDLNIQESPQDGPKTFTISLDADNNCYEYDNSSKFNIQSTSNSTSNVKDIKSNTYDGTDIIHNVETYTYKKYADLSYTTNQATTRYRQHKSESKFEKVPCKKEEFVKLSDLEKPMLMSYRQIKEHNNTDVRMTRSIPEALKINKKQDITRSTGLFSSLDFLQENASSLQRIFPHLKNELSRSTGSIGNSMYSTFDIPCNPLENENGIDTSQESSMQSSLARSNLEVSTTEEMSSQMSVSGNCKQRLGQDLLRMFQEHIGTDVTVEVAGRKMPAHKCILASRFSYNVVHFALCHIYSGTSVIPESISIVELATLADMLGLEGLKEVVMFNLKAKYCHHFHEPCSGCTSGVLECLPLSAAYGLDDIYMKSMRWIRKHYVKIWATKNFATLPHELRETCYQQKMAHLSADNVVDTVAGCGLIMSSLPHGRWTEVVSRTCQRLINAATHLTSRHLLRVLETLISSPPSGPATVHRTIDDCITHAIDWAPVDQVSSSYVFLRTQVLTNECKKDVSHMQSESWELRMVRRWTQLCEDSLEKSRQESSHLLTPRSRVRLQQLPSTDSAQALSPSNSVERKTPKSPNLKMDHIKNSPKSIGIARLRQSFVPYATKPAPSSVDNLASNDMWQERRVATNAPVVRMTKAQEQRSKFNKEVANSRKNHGQLLPIKVYEDKKKSRQLEHKVKNVEKLSSSSSINKEGLNKGDARRALQPAKPNVSVGTKTKIPSLVPPVAKKVPTTVTAAPACGPRRQPLAVRAPDAQTPHKQPRQVMPTKISSFMSATTSSSAKAIVKTTSIEKPNVKKCAEIKQMERSGTFLKDEPTVTAGLVSPSP